MHFYRYNFFLFLSDFFLNCNISLWQRCYIFFGVALSFDFFSSLLTPWLDKLSWKAVARNGKLHMKVIFISKNLATLKLSGAWITKLHDIKILFDLTNLPVYCMNYPTIFVSFTVGHTFQTFHAVLSWMSAWVLSSGPFHLSELFFIYFTNTKSDKISN